MTISVKLLAEPAQFTAEVVVEQWNGKTWVEARVMRLMPGYMAGEYVHSHQRLVVREVKPGDQQG